MLTLLPYIAAILIAIAAGITDLRSRRIPNWLTVSGAALGLATNTFVYRAPGLKPALLGLGLGLALLLPFVLIRSLGAGDWKLAAALGACLGPHSLLNVLIAAVLLAGVMALAVVIYQGRLRETLLNIGRMLAALFSLRLPGAEVSLDNPKSSKIPFGVALALATILYVIAAAMGRI